MADINKTIKALIEWIEDPNAMNAEIDGSLVSDALDLLKEQQAEIKRLRQEKDDAVKRIERCRQNCISCEKDCDIAYNKSGKEWYRAKADAYKQALDIINEP